MELFWPSWLVPGDRSPSARSQCRLPVVRRSACASASRLVDQGIVHAAQMGRNRVHELNREHVAAPVADILANLRLELWRRMCEEISTWDPAPLYACVFGSSAREDGDVDSDVDLLLVHPALAIRDESERWSDQVDTLRLHVRAWSGSLLQAVERSAAEWSEQRKRGRLAEEIHRDAVEMMANVGVAAMAAGTTRGR